MSESDEPGGAMRNLDGIIEKIGQRISEKEKIREDALRFSRDIIIACRRGIQSLHRGLLEPASGFLKQASEMLSRLCALTRDHADVANAGFVESAEQEFVEIQCLFNIMQGADLPDPDEIQVTYSAYLLGLCDVVGELRRGALDFMLDGDTEKANEYLRYMDRIYDAIMGFDYPAALVPIKKKQDMIRALIEKTRGELVVSRCESQIKERSREFNGLLDSVNGKSHSGKKRARDVDEEDINIDKVW
jgi:translin